MNRKQERKSVPLTSLSNDSYRYSATESKLLCELEYTTALIGRLSIQFSLAVSVAAVIGAVIPS